MSPKEQPTHPDAYEFDPFDDAPPGMIQIMLASWPNEAINAPSEKPTPLVKPQYQPDVDAVFFDKV